MRDFPELDSTGEVLAFARARRAEAQRADIDVLMSAVVWASMHPVESIEDAATMPGSQGALAIAGEGAPLVAEFCIAEFAASLGFSTIMGRDLIGAGLELCHRLPATWAKVVRGVLPAWKARRIATMTMSLSPEAAAWVDSQIAPYAAKVSTVGAERLVTAAIARFDPERAEAEAQAAAEDRCVDLHLDQVSALQGTIWFQGHLDLADAVDLEVAVSAGAERLKQLGSTESLDVRRSQALGALARREALDLDTVPQQGEARSRLRSTDQTNRPTDEADRADRERRRQVVLYVHLSEAALHEGEVVARLERGQQLVTVEQVRRWCSPGSGLGMGGPDVAITVRPVIDLADHHHAGSYEVPSRLEEQTDLRDHTCVFPWCTRPARASDHDHVVPHQRDGPTCSCNIAALCRRHHRLKTHGGWTYVPLELGSYVWSSPHGYSYLVDETGTRDVSAPGRRGRPMAPHGLAKLDRRWG